MLQYKNNLSIPASLPSAAGSQTAHLYDMCAFYFDMQL